MADRAFLERLSRELMDKGKLLESGWVSLRVACGLETASEIQLNEMRQAYYAGAQHLFASIMMGLDPGEGPTDNDMRRIDLIREELDVFIRELEERHGMVPPSSRAKH